VFEAIDTSSEAAFTASVLRILQRLDPQGSWSSQEVLVLTNGKQWVVNLHRPWHTCQHSADDCAGSVEHYVTEVLKVSEQPDRQRADRTQLLAVIRHASYFDSLPKEMRGSTISEPFVADLIVIYVVDQGGSVRGVKAEDLTALGISREALPRVAQTNLASVLPGPAHCERDSVVLWATGNYYESSRLLLSRQWSDLTAQGKGRIVVAAPGNDALVVACSPSRELLEKLSAAANEMSQKAERPLSQSLLEWTPKGWRVLSPKEY
jgi:uncharacterized protein YtpQ (UPF0354 family)